MYVVFMTDAERKRQKFYESSWNFCRFAHQYMLRACLFMKFGLTQILHVCVSPFLNFSSLYFINNILPWQTRANRHTHKHDPQSNRKEKKKTFFICLLLQLMLSSWISSVYSLYTFCFWLYDKLFRIVLIFQQLNGITHFGHKTISKMLNNNNHYFYIISIISSVFPPNKQSTTATANCRKK